MTFSERLQRVLRTGERRSVVALLVVGIAATSVFAGEVLKRQAFAVPDTGGVYREGMVGAFQGLDPLLCNDTAAEADLCPLVFAGLTRLDPESGRIVADLARDWKLSGDRRIYTVALDESAAFHDGSPVTSADVLFTYRMFQAPEFTGSYKGIFTGVTMEAVDPRTVKFTLAKENAFFPSLLSLGIIPEHAAKGLSAANLRDHPFRLAPVGAGPFRVTAIDRGTLSTVTTVDLAPVQPARLAGLRIRIYPDDESLLKSLSELDAVREVPGTWDVLTAPGWRSASLRVPRYVGVFFNTERGVVADQRVRSALGISLSRRTIVERVGNAVPVTAPVPALEALNLSAESDELHERLVSRAQELLFDAGWRISGQGARMKGGNALTVTLATRADPNFKKVAEQMKEEWEALGVKVVIRSLSLPELEQAVIRTGEYDALLLGVTTNGSVDLYPYFHSSQVGGTNFSHYKDLNADRLMERIRRTPESAVQMDLARQLVDLLQRDVPAVFLYTPFHPYALRDGLINVTFPAHLVSLADRFELFGSWGRQLRWVWNPPGKQ